jgi:A/G-specific adenine glycosylase
MMELGATVCTPRAPRCGECPVHSGCATRAAGGAPAPAAAGRRPRGAARFEDTDRWARGRIVAALVAGRPLPPELRGDRLERALAGLERDGLVIRGPGGEPRLP